MHRQKSLVGLVEGQVELHTAVLVKRQLCTIEVKEMWAGGLAQSFLVCCLGELISTEEQR